MVNAWSLAASILNGTFDEDYPIVKKKLMKKQDYGKNQILQNIQMHIMITNVMILMQKIHLLIQEIGKEQKELYLE